MVSVGRQCSTARIPSQASDFKIGYLPKKVEMEAQSKKEKVNAINLRFTHSSPERGDDCSGESNRSETPSGSSPRTTFSKGDNV